jgi:hypothetical protein
MCNYWQHLCCCTLYAIAFGTRPVSSKGGHLLQVIDPANEYLLTGLSCLGDREPGMAINATVASTLPASACKPITFDSSWEPDDVPICLISRGGGCSEATKLQHCKQRGSIGAILYNTVGSSGDFIIGPEQDVEMRAAVIGLRVASISYGHYSVLRGYDSRPVRVKLEANAVAKYDVCEPQLTCLQNFWSSWTYLVPVVTICLLLFTSFVTVAGMFCAGSAGAATAREPNMSGCCGVKLCPYIPCCANMTCCTQFYNTPQEYLLPGGIQCACNHCNMHATL